MHAVRGHVAAALDDLPDEFVPGQPGGDVVEFEIAENGEIVWKTPGSISAANHSSADKFTKEVEKLAGGEVTREKLKKEHHHHGHVARVKA